MKNNVIKNTVIYCLALLFIGLGTIGSFHYTDEAKNTGENMKELTQSPLGELRGILVDANGKLYCGVHDYSRIHVYDNQGDFLYSICINGQGGDFKFTLDEDNNVKVATVRNKMLYTFDQDGNLIKTEKNEKAYYDFKTKDDYRLVTKDGVLYKISNPLWIFPRVSKITADGQESILVKSDFKAWLSVSAWLFYGVGLLILGGGVNKLLRGFR